MEKKAKKFVALLAKKFTDGDTIDDSIQIFTSAINNLKEGRLKSELLHKSGIYQKNFIRHLKHLPEEQSKQVDKEDDSSFTMCCHTVADSLERLTVDSPEMLKWTQMILTRGGNSKPFHPELQALNSLLCSRDDYGSVVNTMFLVLSSLQDKVETCVETKNLSRCSGLQKELRILLTFFHIKHQSVMNNMTEVQARGKQKYEDVLASLLSLYVELVLVTARSSEDPTAAGKELCSFISLLMSSWPKHVLDVLLQISVLHPADGVVILPLARKCLKTPPVKPENKLYTKYVLCSRSVVSTFGEEVHDIQQIAESVKAPSTYVNWIREQRPDLMDNFPEDRKFKGRVITRFLLHEADQSITDTLLDILTEELPEPGEASPDESDNKQMIETTTPEVLGESDMPLFFVDTKGKNVKRQNDLVRKRESDSDKETKTVINVSSDDVEVIEVDLSGFDTVRNAGIEDLEKDNDDDSDVLDSDVLVIDEMEDKNIDDNSDVDDNIHVDKSDIDVNSDVYVNSISDIDENSDTDDRKISNYKKDKSDDKNCDIDDDECELIFDSKSKVDTCIGNERCTTSSNTIDIGERDTVVYEDNKKGGDTEVNVSDHDEKKVTDNDDDDNYYEACYSKSEDQSSDSDDIDDAGSYNDDEKTTDDDGDEDIDNDHEMKKVRGKTPIDSKLRSAKSSVVKPSPTVRRVRTRSVSSLENDTSEDLTQERQVNTRSSPLRNSNHKGENIHFMRERPKEVQSPCRFCAEPHCDSSSSSCDRQTKLSDSDVEQTRLRGSDMKQARLRSSDVEHSPSKITKFVSEISPSEDSVKRSSTSKDPGRLSSPPKSEKKSKSRRILSTAESKQYNLRRKSAV